MNPVGRYPVRADDSIVLARIGRDERPLTCFSFLLGSLDLTAETMLSKPYDKGASLEQQLTAARDQYADLGVLIRGDARSELQGVASVLNACKQAGIQELGISVRLARRAELKPRRIEVSVD